MIDLTHRDCGGTYKIIGKEYVDEDYPDVDIYKCIKCNETTLQPDAIEFDEIRHLIP